MTDYSQNKEQEVILRYFNHQIGVFLSVGENDGTSLSNVRALSELGWSGVAVEPCEVPFRKLQDLYKDNHRVQCINVAIADYNGTATLYESGSHLKQGDTGLLSTLSKKETERWGNTETFVETKVDVVDFTTLLEMCNYTKFDMVSCDAEGLDYTILEQMDLNAMWVKLVVVEFNQKDQKMFEDLIIPQGFKLIHQNYENLIFAK